MRKTARTCHPFVLSAGVTFIEVSEVVEVTSGFLVRWRVREDLRRSSLGMNMEQRRSETNNFARQDRFIRTGQPTEVQDETSTPDDEKLPVIPLISGTNWVLEHPEPPPATGH